MVNHPGFPQITTRPGLLVKQRRLKAGLGLSSIVIAAVLAAACGGGTEPTLDTQIGGAWHLVVMANDSQQQPATTKPPFTYCTLTGNLAITQVGSTFTGQLTGSTQTCTGPNATSGSWDGPVTDGLIVGHDIRFLIRSSLHIAFAGSDSASPGTVITSNYLWWYNPQNQNIGGIADHLEYGTFKLTR